MTISNEQMTELFYENPIEGVDYSDGFTRFSNQAPIYLRVLRAFVNSAPELLEKLAELTPQTISDYTIRIHGLKGSCYGVSATTLGDEARALEIASKADDWQTLQRGNPEIIEHTYQLIDQFIQLIETIEQANNQQFAGGSAGIRPLLQKPDPQLIQCLLTAIQNFDVEAIEKLIDQLDQASYSADPQLTGFLRQNLLLFRYDQLEKRLIDLLG
jgi:HPt (histidine-containing phosphotransfer) domain-containing protein